LSYIAS